MVGRNLTLLKDGMSIIPINILQKKMPKDGYSPYVEKNEEKHRAQGTC